ncbi:MAG: DUF4271 domain-containing protein [Flavobacteriia bacterium]|nr:DUF4271 domain-containing protein [Flavobacteriia bacterium]
MEPILRPTLIPDWIAAILLVSLILMVVSKERFGYRFSVFMSLISNTKYILVFNKKQGFIHPFQLIWHGFAILNCSLFLYLNKKQIAVIFQNSDLLSLSFTNIILGITAFVLLKQLAQLIHGSFFNSLKMMQEFLFKKSSYFNYASLIFFVSNIISLFLLADSMLLFIISLACVLSITLIGWLVILRNRQKYITDQFFYFILYLCALEIAPFLVIGSVL